MLPADVVKKVIDALQSGDLETTGIYLSGDLVYRGATPSPLNKQQYLELMDALLTAIPNLSFNPRDIQERGDTVRMKVRMTGKNAGPLKLRFMGVGPVPPQGVKITLPEEYMEFTVKDNKIYAIKMEQVPHGGIEGILEQLDVKVPALVGA